MELALKAALPPLTLAGDLLLPLFETARTLLLRGTLTPEWRALVSRIREVEELVARCVLEAQDQEDLRGRVDQLIEDPSFYQLWYGFLSAAWPRLDTLLKEAEGVPRPSGPRSLPSSLGEALGPAAIPSLRVVDACMQALIPALRHMAAQIPEEALAQMLPDEDSDPLAFLSDFTVPVPMARALLAGLRSNALIIAAGVAAARQPPIERWLGLAIAEYCADETRQFLTLYASLPGFDIPYALVPLHMRFDPQVLAEHSKAVYEALTRFESEADRSGEPIYPAVAIE